MRARNRNRPADARAHDARALAGVIVAGLLMGGVASVVLGTAGELQAAGPAETQAPTAKPPAKGTAAVPASKKDVPAPAKSVAAPAKPVVAPAKAVAAPAKAADPTAKPTPSPATVKSTSNLATSKPAPSAKVAATAPRPSAPATGSAIVQSSARVDEQLTYQYNALGRRDPFQSLFNGEYVGADVGGNAPPDVGGIKVVGIVWGDADQFALVEDARGDSHILRRGDKVMNGFVEALKREAMVVNLTVDGQSQSVTVPLTRKGDKTNANR